MERQPGDRIFGIETEFGCLVESPDVQPETAVELIKDCVFDDLKMGVKDLHARDEVFEPAGSGGFLLNGGRLYIDAVGSHLEYATAECRKLDDLVAQDRAGQRLILRAINEAGLSDQIRVYNNSVDHFGGHTFGCHENYLVKMTEDFFSEEVPLLYSFLVTRQIYAGVGRVGGHILADAGAPDYESMARNPIDYIWVSQVYNVYADENKFQLSQRADHILRTIASRVRFNRALINPKWEHFYAHEGMHRLHLLFGEANQSEYAYKLKVGTTSLVLRLLEDGHLKDIPEIDQPLIHLRSISRDEKYDWEVVLSNGEETTAIDIQLRHLDLAEQFRDDSEDTNWILDNWRTVLETLRKNPMELDDRLDWVAKLSMMEAFLEDSGGEWSDDILHSIDLEYHNIDPGTSLFYALQQDGKMVRTISDSEITEASVTPPLDTRAAGRANIVRTAIERLPDPYIIDWSGAVIGRNRPINMPDPFHTYQDATR